MSRPFGNISQSAQGCTSPHLIISYQVPLIYFHYSSHQMTHTECHAELRSPWVPLGIVRGPSTPNQVHPASLLSPHHFTIRILTPSAHCQLIVTSSSFHCSRHIITSVSVIHISLSLSSLISSQSHCLLHYSFILWFHFYFLTLIYLYLYLYIPFPSRDPHLFILG